jgi:prolipoprotein diacylglyceryltransferase
MLYAGTCAGIAAGTMWAAVRGLDPYRVQAAMLLLVIPALAGARLLFVFTNWSHYRRHRQRIWSRSEGGASLYGGLILSFVASIPLLATLRLPVAAFWDAVAVTMAMAMVFTKIGCLMNGCCEGRPSDGAIAMNLPNVSGVWRRRIPTQLLEGAVAAVVLCGAALWGIRGAPDGSFALFAYGTYGAGRFFLEPTRASIDRVGTWNLHQMLSIAVVVVSGICAVLLLTGSRSAGL